MYKIRPENETDCGEIAMVNDAAFGRDNEALMIAALRQNPRFIPGLSLIAEFDETIVGHILFFPVDIVGDSARYETLSLAPMAVAPDWQNRGVGTQLVITGMDVAREMGFDSITVLGHPDYYPRFDFQKASTWNLRPPFEVPDEVFMALELQENALQGKEGVVEYPEEYSIAM